MNASSPVDAATLAPLPGRSGPTQIMPTRFATDLNRIVDAYETRQSAVGEADVAEFLPDRSHPEYAAIALELVRVDIEYAWNRHRPRSLEEYRQLVPDLFADPEIRSSIAFEEYRQRRLAGEPATRDEYARHFNVTVDDWVEIPGPEDQRPVPHDPDGDATTASPGFPCEGSCFAGFELLEELGRGGSSRVFLARQPSLAQRQVVLKISQERTVEPDRLARLQHTNIMPIHSFHTQGNWHAICMPYLGSLVLSQWTEILRQRSAPPDSIAELETLRASTWESRRLPPHVDPAQLPGASPSRLPPLTPASPSASTFPSLGASGNYERTILQLAAKLAQALIHAHDRGILHLDLKPANILLTGDGEPMLLDFHLSTGGPGEKPVFLGGTLPYMSPEQLRQWNAPSTVDVRSDLFSFGVVLFELLTGRQPYPRRPGKLPATMSQMIQDRQQPPALQTIRPSLAPATCALVAKCLDPRPARRYQSARELWTDLDRHLRDLPLQFAPNPSWNERRRKFCRRHPRLTSGGMVLTVALGVAAAAGGGWRMREQRLAGLEALNVFSAFERGAAESKMSLLLPDLSPLEREREVQTARQLLGRYGVERSDDWRRDSSYRALDAGHQTRVEQNVGHLLFLLAEQPLAPPSVDALEATAESLSTALALNRRAQTCFPALEVPRALRTQQHRLQQRLQGHSGPAVVESIEAAAPTSQTDRLFLATDRVARGDYRNALTLLNELEDSLPNDFSVQFLRGICHASLGEPALAEGDFSAALALRPESVQAIYQRGRARFEQQRLDEARHDFSAALQRDPEFLDALVSLGLTREAEGDLPGALHDISRAIDRDYPETRIYFLRARLRHQLGDESGAEQDRQAGLSRTPTDATSWVSRGVAALPDDPHRALEDFRAALQLNPREFQAQRNLAHVLSEHMHQPREALRVLDDLLAQSDGDTLAWVGRGVLRARSGDCEGAQSDAERALAIRRSPLVVYQAACIAALCGNQSPQSAAGQQVLALLAEAIQLDPSLIPLAPADPDLQSVSGSSEFQELIAAASRLQSARHPAPTPQGSRVEEPEADQSTP